MWCQPLETQVAEYNKRTKDLKNQNFLLTKHELDLGSTCTG